MPSGHN